MKKIKSLLVSIMLIFALVGGADYKIPVANAQEPKTQQSVPAEGTSNSQIQDAEQFVNGQLKVHFIDVGQADSILVQDGTYNMLIDAGNNADADTVVNYIKQQGVTKLDYLVGTHPHEDHIGGMDAVINAFDIGVIYMPQITSTTQTFKDVITAMAAKSLKATIPLPGSTFNIGDATCTVLAPNSSSYEDLNNYSIVVKLTHGNNSFMFDGDAEDVSENEMLTRGFDLSTTVLKVGHHGSDSSTTQTFLDKVNPKYAVISVGVGNDYGHPTKQTMDRLKAKNIPVYRTDQCGTIVATSDGTNITFNVNPGDYSYASESGQTNTSSTIGNDTAKPVPSNNGDRVVYWTEGGKSYHYDQNCSTLSRSKNILQGPLSQCPKSDPCDKCVK